MARTFQNNMSVTKNLLSQIRGPHSMNNVWIRQICCNPKQRFSIQNYFYFEHWDPIRQAFATIKRSGMIGMTHPTFQVYHPSLWDDKRPENVPKTSTFRHYLGVQTCDFET